MIYNFEIRLGEDIEVTHRHDETILSTHESHFCLSDSEFHELATAMGYVKGENDD